jgi:hypothetical protein
MNKTKDYGTVAGMPVTEATLAEWNDEIERRFPPDEPALERRGRPSLGSGGESSVLQVRIEPELREALESRVRADGLSRSELTREALREYLSAA